VLGQVVAATIDAGTVKIANVHNERDEALVSKFRGLVVPDNSACLWARYCPIVLLIATLIRSEGVCTSAVLATALYSHWRTLGKCSAGADPRTGGTMFSRIR
jgi:hypothetical protein